MPMITNKFGNCPECGEKWGHGDQYETFLGQDWWKKTMTQEQLRKEYEGKQWSHLIGIEVHGMYDGVCEWKCPFCQTRWSRFTGEKMRVRYHIQKGSRMYMRRPYCGYSSDNKPAEAETMFEALEVQKTCMKNNPGVGWDIYDADTGIIILPEEYVTLLKRERGY